MKKTHAPRHADSFAPDNRPDRPLRLCAGGRPRLATGAAQPLTGAQRAVLLGACARACAPRRYTPSLEALLLRPLSVIAEINDLLTTTQDLRDSLHQRSRDIGGDARESHPPFLDATLHHLERIIFQSPFVGLTVVKNATQSLDTPSLRSFASGRVGNLFRPS